MRLGRRWATSARLALLLVLCGPLTACGLHHGSDPDLRLGGASRSDGAVLWPGRVTHDEVLGYAFPPMTNATDVPIKIQGFHVDHVPDGVKVLKYRLLSMRDTSGYLLGSFPADQRDRDGYDRYPDHPLPTLAPHRRSLLYGVVYLKVPGPLATPVTGCSIDYSIGGEARTAHAPCEFPLQKPRHG